eukprot:12502786-Alexandrium_andersonii.AAC.1
MPAEGHCKRMAEQAAAAAAEAEAQMEAAAAQVTAAEQKAVAAGQIAKAAAAFWQEEQGGDSLCDKGLVCSELAEEMEKE